MKKNNKFNQILLAVVLTIFFMGLGSGHLYAKKKGEKWRIGFGRIMTGTTYTYDTQRRSSDAGSIDTAVTATNSGTTSLTVLTTEYVLGGLLGLEFNLGLINNGQQNFTFSTVSKDSATTKIGDITEELQISYLYGGNWYMTDASAPGWNVLLGVFTGIFKVRHTFTDGGSRDDDTADGWTGFNYTQNSSLEVPVEGLKLGFEYEQAMAGVIIDYYQITSEVKNRNYLGLINSGLQ